MTKRWRLHDGATLLAALCVAFVAACSGSQLDEELTGGENNNQSGNVFTTAPELILSKSGDEKTVTVRWSSASPSDGVTYDLYYAAEDTSDAAAVKRGTRVAAVSTGVQIPFYTPGTYSFLVMAKKSGYPSKDSTVKKITLVFEIPPHPAAGTKRGVSYNFTDQGGGAGTAASVMAMLESVSWFYNWGTEPNAAVDTAATSRSLDYFPMAWNAAANIPGKIRAYKQAHPECEYLLAYNEPNLTDQANMTPTQAAAAWPQLKALAQELNLKIVAPAMNYGTLSGYSDPITWLDEFFAKDGVSLDDVSAIAIHCYMAYPGGVKGYIDMFKKYGKPIWMTEFCAWDQNDYVVMHNAADQMRYLSEVVTYMELDPAVERYAWFIPVYGNNGNEYPYMQLLTKANPPALTDLGTVYAKMSFCDQNTYIPAGTKIEAEQFANCNLSEWVSRNDQWPNGGTQNDFYMSSVHFRPSTDGSDNTLDIFEFRNTRTDQWVEYQVATTEARQYTLSLRYQATQAATVQITVDGGAAVSATLDSTSWATKTVNVTIPAGQHKIRLKISAGNCALNWLKIE